MSQVRDKDRGWKKLGSMLKRQAHRGPHVKVGVLGPDAEAAHADDNLTVVEVASFHEFGRGNNPERSFIRSTFDGNRKAYATMMRKLADKVITGKMQPKMALGVVGMKVQSDIQKRIETGIAPPLKAATIARKRSTKPLIDTGQLKNSVTYQVGDV